MTLYVNIWIELILKNRVYKTKSYFVSCYQATQFFCKHQYGLLNSVGHRTRNFELRLDGSQLKTESSHWPYDHVFKTHLVGSSTLLVLRGWTLIMGNTRPEYLLRGPKFSGKKIWGHKFFGENSWGLKSISKIDLSFFKISIFLEVTDPNIVEIATISEIRKAEKPNFWVK